MRSRFAVPGLLAALAAGTLALIPADAAAPRSVAGSVQQAYRATVRPSADDKPLRTVHEKGYRGAKLAVDAAYVGRNAAEPTIGVTSDGTAFFAAGDFDGVGGAAARTEILASDDGRRWSSVQQRIGSAGHPPATLDPYVWVDPWTDRVFSVDLYVGCSYLSWTDDLGESWTDNPLACGVPVNDHQTLVSGPPRPGDVTVGYPNVVYYCVNQVADVACGKSLNGGLTFQPAGAPAFTGIDPAGSGLVCGGLHGHITVDVKGRLYLPKGHCGQPWLAISEDGGITWTRTKVSDIPTASHQSAVAVDDAENIYYVWWDREDHLPYMAVSRDHGKTWGKPLLIAPPGVQEVNFPSVDASGKGRVAISFPGTTVRDREDSSRPWNYYVVQTMNALEGRPLFVSATANPPSDPIHRGNCTGRCGGMFDFLDVVIAPSGQVWAAATDTCTSAQACNSKNGTRAPDMKGMAVWQVAGPGMPKRR